MENLKDRLIKRMKEYFGEDEKRIRHALRVTEFAEDILFWEKEAERDIVLAAAILHDIGIHEAERKYGSSSGKYQEIEGPPIAKKIMLQEKLPREKIEEVCQIIAHHHTLGIVDTINFKVLYDADRLVNLENGEIQTGKLLTKRGKKLAISLNYEE